MLYIGIFLAAIGATVLAAMPPRARKVRPAALQKPKEEKTRVRRF
jgi:hypothetical protein